MSIVYCFNYDKVLFDDVHRNDLFPDVKNIIKKEFERGSMMCVVSSRQDDTVMSEAVIETLKKSNLYYFLDVVAIGNKPRGEMMTKIIDWYKDELKIKVSKVHLFDFKDRGKLPASVELHILDEHLSEYDIYEARGDILVKAGVDSRGHQPKTEEVEMVDQNHNETCLPQKTANQ